MMTRLALIAAILSLAACSSTPERKQPKTAAAPVSEGRLETRAKGMASWYGKRFHQRRTASGEHFDMNAMTAAHRTLPFGTKVEVTNLKTGKSVVVRINDRGPFSRHRVIDVSYGAAKSIGLVTAGVAPVELKVLN